MKCFKINSKVIKVILISFVVLMIVADLYVVWAKYSDGSSVLASTIFLIIIGSLLRFAILLCLLLSKGPAKGLIYIWGGMFLISGVTGLLSLMMSVSIEPIQMYFDKALYSLIGLGLIFTANKFIQYTEPSKEYE